MDNLLDAYLARFQNLPNFEIRSISPDGMFTNNWFVVTGDVVKELVINELNIPVQVSTVTGDIQKWGRLTALAKRVWEVEERCYRTWRSAFWLKAISGEAKPKDWKKPSADTIECMYRVEPEYQQYQIRIERAEEAYNATESILQAFRAKKDMLQRMSQIYREDGMPANLI